MNIALKKIIANKELFWSILYQVVNLVGKLFLIKLLAIALPLNDFGYYMLFMSIVAFVIMFPFTALLQGIGRYISIYQKRSKYNTFFTSMVLVFLILIALYIVIALVLKFYLPSNNTWNSIYSLIVIFIFSEIFKIFFVTINNINRERKNIAIAVILEFTSKLGLIYLIYLESTVNIVITVYILILSNLLSTMLLLYKNKNHFNFKQLNMKESKIFLLRVWFFSLPLVIWAIFGWLRDMSSRWYLDYFLDKESVAQFGMIVSVAMMLPAALQAFIGSFFMPILYQKENDIKGYTRRFLSYLIPILLLFFLFSFWMVMIFQKEILLLASDEKYLSVSWMLPWVFLIYSVYVVSMIATYELFAHKQTKKLIWSSIVPGVVSIIFGYFLIKDYGINGALYHYMVTYLSYSLLTFYVVFNYWRKNDNN